MYIRALDTSSYKVLTQRLLLLTERNCLPPTNKAYPESNREEHGGQSTLRDCAQSN